MSIKLFDHEGNCESCGAHFHEHGAEEMTECARALMQHLVDMPEGDEFMDAFGELIDFARSRMG